MKNLSLNTGSLRGAEVGERLEFERTLARPGLSDVPLRDLIVTGTVSQLGDRLLAEGTAAGTLRLACSRCLKEFETPLQVTFSEEFAEAPGEEQFAAASEAIDLAEMLRTVLLMALPERPLHDLDCRGLCPVCGKDLNEQPHNHPAARKTDNNPFSVLKRKGR